MSTASVASFKSMKSFKSTNSLRSNNSSIHNTYANRSSPNLLPLDTAIITGGELDQLSLSPQQSRRNLLSPNKEDSAFDFELSQAEIDELLGASHKIFGNDPPRIPPPPAGLDGSSTTLSQSSTQEILALPNKEPKKKHEHPKVIGYKSVHSQEFGVSNDIKPPSSKFKYNPKPNPAFYIQDESEAGLTSAFSKVSLVLSEDKNNQNPKTSTQIIPQLTGKYFSKHHGVIAKHPITHAVIQARIQSPLSRSLQAEISIEPMESLFSLQSHALISIERQKSAEDLIEIPTARARTPKPSDNKADPSLDNMNDDIEGYNIPDINENSNLELQASIPNSNTRSRVSKNKSKSKVERIAYVLSPLKSSHDQRVKNRNLRTQSRLDPILRAKSAGLTNPRSASPSPQRMNNSSSTERLESDNQFIAHRKMLGWKLTSVSKRRELMELLDVLTQRNNTNKPNRSPPVGRKKQLLLSQLEQELFSTSQSMLLSPPKELGGNFRSAFNFVEQHAHQSNPSLVHRQSAAYEKYVSRSLGNKLSYKSKVGMDYKMKESKTVKNLVHRIKTPAANGLNPVTPGRYPQQSLVESYESMYTEFDPNSADAMPAKSVETEMTAHSLDVLKATMNLFPNQSMPGSSGNGIPDSANELALDRPASRFVQSRSRRQSDSRSRSRSRSRSKSPGRNSSRQKSKGSGKDKVKDISKAIYDLPYNVKRPLDRMDILQSVHVRSQLAPIVHSSSANMPPSQLFNAEYTQSVTNPTVPADSLLSEYVNSSNSILRMLSRDHTEDPLLRSTRSSQLFEASAELTHQSSLTEDDELVDAFIEERYKVARMKKHKHKQVRQANDPQFSLVNEVSISNEQEADDGRAVSVDDQDDDHSVGNRSMSSLGDQSAAVYDLILPTASSAIPPPRLRSNTVTTLPSMSSFPKEGHSHVLSQAQQSAASQSNPPGENTPQLFSSTNSVISASENVADNDLEPEEGESNNNIPVTPW